MLRTRVGYCGGAKEEPTYHSMGDHTESISIDFDPAILTFEEILGHFWNGHRCERNHPSRQYMNAFFYRDDRQLEAAESSREAHAASLGIEVEQIATKLLPATAFTYAEGYHQKYYLTRHHDLRDFLESNYPEAKQLADSAVATRLNAFLGSGMERDWDRFRNELPEFGLPEALESSVRTMVPS